MRDLGPGDLDLVAILDAIWPIAARPGGARAEPVHVDGGRGMGAVAGQCDRPVVLARRSDRAGVRPRVPDRFHADERRRRAEAGLPIGAAVFRITGGDALEVMDAFDPVTLLVSEHEGRTVCLLALDPDRVPVLGTRLRELAADGTVDRVEAEPHL